MAIQGYGQYKDDFFNKLNFSFRQNSTLLDVGCGDGTDGKVFIREYGLKCFGFDLYKHENIQNAGLRYSRGSIYSNPFKNRQFDYVYSHDVLHHVDEPKQRRSMHIKALKEMRFACNKGGHIIIVEGNRYNPLFYPHMVKMHKHEHFTQKYFCALIEEIFAKDRVEYRFFEAHLYPFPFLFIFKIYETIMECFSPKQFLAYNVAIIKRA